jgi:hypothetical protein
MRILITGASGFIGQSLIEALLEQGCSITAVTRSVDHARQIFPADVHIIDWDHSGLRAALAMTDVVINLAGEPISGKSWNKKKKISIINSRILAAQRLMEAMINLKQRPGVFIQASAIGIYGNRGDESCIEVTPKGDGFLAEVCAKWENHIPDLEKIIDRVLTIRIGVVLGKDGGMLPKLIKLNSKRIAGKAGNGKQYLSWIHTYDLVYAIIYLMNDEKAKGCFNLVAPEPIRQKDLMQQIGRLTSRKFQLGAPAFMIKALYGEMGSELVLSGQKVSSAKLQNRGFLFKFSSSDEALKDLL